MATTTYTVQAANEQGEFVATGLKASKKDVAVAKAEALRAEQKVAVQVVTGAGTVVFEAAKPKLRVITVHTKPYTKDITDALPDEVRALVPEGYTAAYRRPKNGAVVLRREVDLELEDGEQDEQRYLVISEVKGKRVGFAPTTRAAGALMKGLKAGKPVNA